MDKIDRLLDAIEHPENYTQTEIETMLLDPEVKEMFDLLGRTKSSLQPIITPDIDEEWKKFETKNCRRKKLSRFNLLQMFSRNAAASIVIAIASFTAVAALVGAGIYHTIHQPDVNQADTAPTTYEGVAYIDTIKVTEAQDSAAIQTIVFEDEPLEAILSRISEYYGYDVTFNDNSVKSLRLYFRWNQALTLEEVVNRLNNFEQIHLTVKDKIIKVD